MWYISHLIFALAVSVRPVRLHTFLARKTSPVSDHYLSTKQMDKKTKHPNEHRESKLAGFQCHWAPATHRACSCSNGGCCSCWNKVGRRSCLNRGVLYCNIKCKLHIKVTFYTCMGGGFLGGLWVLLLLTLGTGRGVEEGVGWRREGESDNMEERRVVRIGVGASGGRGLPLSNLFPWALFDLFLGTGNGLAGVSPVRSNTSLSSSSTQLLLLPVSMSTSSRRWVSFSLQIFTWYGEEKFEGSTSARASLCAGAETALASLSR